LVLQFRFTIRVGSGPWRAMMCIEDRLTEVNMKVL